MKISLVHARWQFKLCNNSTHARLKLFECISQIIILQLDTAAKKINELNKTPHFDEWVSANDVSLLSSITQH